MPNDILHINAHTGETHTEVLADRRADRMTYLYVLVFTFASFLILSLSEISEYPQENSMRFWIDMGTSHFVIALCDLAIPFALTKAPLARESLKTSIPIHVFACIVFSAVHILLMVGMRALLYPPLVGEALYFGLGDFNVWLYEFRKDAYSYVLILFLFQTGRQLMQARLELSVARAEARQNHRLTLKSGGRSIFLNADDVLWAKAASNYVEIHTQTGTHLARMTLARLRALLEESGSRHVQAHRSYIVHRNAIREIIPTGEGDAKLVLTNGERIPVSRGYRAELEGIAQS